MTDIQSNPTIDDPVDDLDSERARLDGAGYRWSEGSETRSFACDQGLRETVRPGRTPPARVAFRPGRRRTRRDWSAAPRPGSRSAHGRGRR